jgi:hypothetical protein
MTCKRPGNDPHPVADPGVFPSAPFVWQVDGALRSPARSASIALSGTCTGSSLPILTSRITPGHCRTLCHCSPMRVQPPFLHPCSGRRSRLLTP